MSAAQDTTSERDMPRTFEERIAEELDALYAGALFLADHHPVEAEELLTDSVTAAFRRWGHEPDRADLGRLLRGELARRAHAAEGRRGGPPAAGRAALWLVAVQRWRHADAAEALGLDLAALRDALVRQRAWMKDMLADEYGPVAEGSGA